MGFREAIAVGALGAAAALSGCVERCLVVRSDPRGAKVFVDGAPRGETPCSVPFTFYGTREVVLRAPGRRSKRLLVPLRPPWWQILPLDFVTEVLLPVTIRDERVVEARLEPAPRPSDRDLEALRRRAEERRKEGL